MRRFDAVDARNELQGCVTTGGIRRQRMRHIGRGVDDVDLRASDNSTT
jgi:hypothetical protein